MPHPIWIALSDDLHPDEIGFLATWLDTDDPRCVADQIGDNYVGGWHPWNGYHFNTRSGTLTYKSDPPLYPIAATKIRDEMVLLYSCSRVLILQPDNSFEIARID